MSQFARVALVAAALAVATTIAVCDAKVGDEAGLRSIPAPFAPLEYLVGRWNGLASPKDNPAQKFRGWNETHTWAWSFAGGKPVGLRLTIEGGKILATGKLTYEPARKLYRLEGTEPGPAVRAIVFEGTLDRTGKYLVLDHAAADVPSAQPAGTLRLSIWPNANFIRYSMAHDLRDAGAVQFTRLIEVGLTRDGESLAGVATASERPKCIVTGGAATMTLSYKGRTFPICCTGCRDEFNENPAKYLKKASLIRNSQAGKATSSLPTAPPVRRFDDAFADDVVDSPSKAKQPPALSNTGSGQADSTKGPAPTDSHANSKKDRARSTASKASSRAASLLKLGQNLEKSGKASAALGYYRRVVKEFAETAAAKTAAARIRALDKP